MDDLLFDPQLIPLSVRLPPSSDLEIRPLRSSDHRRGHFELLSVLTAAPSLSPEDYNAQFQYMKRCPSTYFTIVIVQKSTDTLVACGTTIIERKFTRGGGLVGHIEDIAVSKKLQGQKLGLKIINTLEAIGVEQGCYKTILDCSKANIAFYEKCGFTHKEYQMVRYKSEQSSQPAVNAKL